MQNNILDIIRSYLGTRKALSDYGEFEFDQNAKEQTLEKIIEMDNLECSGVSDKDFNKIIEVMTSKDKSYRDKIKAVKLLRIMVIRKSQCSRFFKKNVKKLNVPFELAIIDGNDEYTRETCITIELMASVLKGNFLATSVFIMPILYVILPVNPDIKKYVVSTLEVIAESMESFDILEATMYAYKHSNAVIRKEGFKILHYMLQNWNAEFLNLHHMQILDNVYLAINAYGNSDDDTNHYETLSCLNELIRLYASTPGCKVYVPRQLGIDCLGANIDINTSCSSSCYSADVPSSLSKQERDFDVMKMAADDKVGVLKFIEEIDAQLNLIGRRGPNQSQRTCGDLRSIRSTEISTFMDDYEAEVQPNNVDGTHVECEYLDVDQVALGEMRPRQIAEQTIHVIEEVKTGLDTVRGSTSERFMAEYERISEESIRENEFRITQKLQLKSSTLAGRLASQISFARELANWRKMKEMSTKKYSKFACKSRFNILLQDNLPYEDYPRKQICYRKIFMKYSGLKFVARKARSAKNFVSLKVSRM